MLLSTPGLVLHTTPYAETSVVCKVFTRQLGMRSYIIKGVRGNRGRMKQNMLQPLSSLDMVVYDSHRTQLNYIKELSPRRPDTPSEPVGNALRFFMTEVLYKALREEEPMPELWDYVDTTSRQVGEGIGLANLPITFMLGVADHLGVMPMDNLSPAEPYFDLDDGRFVGLPEEATLPLGLSALLHQYLGPEPPVAPLQERNALLSALIAYFELHLSGFRNFTSHEILHTILR